MIKKTDLQNFQIARFALNAKFEDIGEANIAQLKRHLLDSLGSLIHATKRPTIQKLVKQLQILSDGGKCKVPIIGSLSYDRAAQLYTALIRYPDFMDNFLGKEATCHPSDNIGSLLAASQYRTTSGKDFLTAMAVSYQIECRLVQEIPVMKEGIDHTLLLGYSLIGGIARLIGLTEEQAAHALGITGTSISPMVTSRAAYTFEWKGFASSLDALNCMGIAFLAQQGITGPIAIFEGPKGFDEVFGMKLDYDWSKETFELISKCILKRYNSEVHSQPALEAIEEIRRLNVFSTDDIEKIDITTFLTAYHIIGSGAYGDRKIVNSKEQADHSLFYTIAALLLDGDVYPQQFEPERIKREDAQQLLQKVFVHTGFPLHRPVMLAGILDPYTESYPRKMRAKVEIKLNDGKVLSAKKEDYHGFYTRPFTWDDTIKKFRRLVNVSIALELQQQIIEIVMDLENQDQLSGLIDLISKVA